MAAMLSPYLNTLFGTTDKKEEIWLTNFYASMPSELQSTIDKATQIKEASQDTVRRSIGLIDHTSLKVGDKPMIGTESPDDIKKLCQKALGQDAFHTAAVCVFPNQIYHAKTVLHGSPVKLAAVNNFPHGDLSAEDAAADAARSIAKGANEIDTVLDYVEYLEYDIAIAREKLEAVSATCKAKNVKLKIILKSSTHNDYQSLYEAAQLACECGADFVKTCTGKEAKEGWNSSVIDVSNLLTMATVMQSVAAYNREHKANIGVKISGGVKYPVDCERLRFLAAEIMGAEHFNAGDLRIGASSLRSNLNPHEKGAQLTAPPLKFQ